MKALSSETDGTIVSSQRSESLEDFEQPRYSRRDTLLTMAGVLMVMLLSSLDQTIVSTALPHIIADLNGFNEYTWVSTAYLLASTVMVPIYGKLSDLFGRKSIFLFAVVVFLIGSALSGASQTMEQLIAFRAFQGLGAGGLISIAIAIVGDLFTPRERAKWQGVTGAVFGISSIIGPTVGGFITDNTSWRWVFYVNLPIGIAALLVLIFLMPTLRVNRKVSIDYIGAALLVAWTIPLLLGFTWAGSQYDWLSPQILSLLTVAVVALIAFIVYESWLERRGGQPIIEPSLFRNSIFSISAIVTVIFGISMFASIYFITLFAQGVVGTSATNSGVITTPLMLTAVTGSILSGQLVARLGKYKLLAVLGTLITIGGSVILLLLNVHSTNTDVVIAMLVLGLGMGLGMSLYTLIVQNALPRKIGQASATLVFFRSIGGTIGLGAMGSLMNAAYLPTFQNALPATVKHIPGSEKILSAFNNPQILLSPSAQQQIQKALAGIPGLYNQIIEAARVGLAQGIHNIFVLGLGLTIISLVAVFFLKEIPLRSKRESSAVRTKGDEETAHEVEGSLATMG